MILNITSMKDKFESIPRQLEIHGKICDLFWNQAIPFCRYCKTEGHRISQCSKLEKKKLNKYSGVQSDQSLTPQPPIQDKQQPLQTSVVDDLLDQSNCRNMS